MSTARGRRAGGRAGFTLVEALAAFVIVATLGLAIQRGVVQSRFGWQWIEDRADALRLARSLLEQPVSLAQAAAGGWEGSAAGRRFRVVLGPTSLPLPEPPEDGTPIRWVPLQARIEVEVVRGALAVETVRLCPFRTGRSGPTPPRASRG